MGAQGEIGLEDVRIKIAGMPFVWKMVNFVVILIPKVVLWKLTAEVGVMSLMETSDIDNIITNCVSLTFILNIDETVCAVLLPTSAIRLLSKCGDWRFPPETWRSSSSSRSGLNMPSRTKEELRVLRKNNRYCSWRAL